MTGYRQKKGKKAEGIACRYLEQKGYRILDRNYRAPTGEIDIIASHETFLVFIEVKARTSLRRGRPEEAVNGPKQKKIILTASWYIKERRLLDARVRFDVVALTETAHHVSIDVFENAFQAQ